jgi:ATP-dependent DNA ligase
MERVFIKPYKSMTRIFETYSVLDLHSQLESGVHYIEPKIDGMAIWVQKLGGEIKIFSADKLDLTDQFPEVSLAARDLSVYDFVLVGELVKIDESGNMLPHEDVIALSHRKEQYRGDQVRAIIYDVLVEGGIDIRSHLLKHRRSLLCSAFKVNEIFRPIDFASYHTATSLSYFARDIRAKTTEEGVVVKHDSSTYDHHGSKKWWKLKWHSELDLIVTDKRLVKVNLNLY